MYIADMFILARFLRSDVALSMIIIVIIIRFFFSDEHIPNLLMFFKWISVKDARWYYNHYLIFKFFLFSFSLLSNDAVVLRLFDIVLLTVRLCITKNSIVSTIISFSAVRKHIWYESELWTWFNWFLAKPAIFQI